ncbi:hypothetical protein RFN29_28655 [Mesorhizobium sp. VK22B]|uniref:Uncharacterized protein n=1 Tax=Mesorhizobium captivum TaxID=3072319 RepID=A0ABU4ZC40_9HYPH|nr:hypothetical protein [Mesorhizobium sp. VK22B]MDX8495532.1 hypothetical protein [Mesorhizobium sp. VK22B]
MAKHQNWRTDGNRLSSLEEVQGLSPGGGACDAYTRCLLEDLIDAWSDKALGAAYLDIPRSAPAAWAGAWGETAGARHSRRAAPFCGSDTHSQPSSVRVPAVLL